MKTNSQIAKGKHIPYKVETFERDVFKSLGIDNYVNLVDSLVDATNATGIINDEAMKIELNIKNVNKTETTVLTMETHNTYNT